MTLESSSELLEALEADCRCRTDQIWQLLTFYHVRLTSGHYCHDGGMLTIIQDIYPSPTTLVVYGIRGSGKLTTVSSVLEARQIQYAIIRSEECLSLRHFLSSIQRACHGSNGQLRQEDSQVESVNALCASLERARRYEDERFVLILDGVDKQRGLHPTTLPALVRLGDRVCYLVGKPREVVVSVYLMDADGAPNCQDSQALPHSHCFDNQSAISAENRNSIPALSTLQPQRFYQSNFRRSHFTRSTWASRAAQGFIHAGEVVCSFRGHSLRFHAFLDLSFRCAAS